MMAEFQEVAKHWKRMCKKYWRSTTCHGCPIAEYERRYEACAGYDIDVSKMEENVLTWAAEHPEPVYPTWDEWLTEMGILQSPLPVPNMTVVAYYGGLKAHDPIPAEIAQKLGLEPKEGT